MARNRLMFEPDDSETIRTAPQAEQQTEEIEYGDPVYLDETARSARSLRTLIAAGVILILLLMLGAGAFYLWRSPEKSLPEGRITLDGARDRYYIPESDLTEALKKGRQQYLQLARDDARRTFHRILDDSTDDRERSIAHIYLGVMALEEDRPGQAKHHFLSAYRLDESSVGALVNLAIVERKLGNREEAQRYAEQAKKLAPKDPAVAMILANLLLESSNPEKAEEIYREGMSQSPDDTIMRYNLGLALLRQNKLDEAELEFNRLVEMFPSDPLAVRALAYLGQIAFMKNRPEQSAQYFRRAAALAPDEARYHYNLGVALLRLRDNQGALQAFDQALKAGGSDADVFQSLAHAYERLNEPAMAAKALERALFMNPQNVNVLFQLGDLHHRQRDLLRAAENYRKIVNITPGDTNTKEALIRLGRVYREMERYQDSADVLGRAAALSPEDGQVLYELGLTYRMGNRFDNAVAAWRKALQNGVKLDRSDERTIRLALGDSYRAKGAYDLALNEYRQVEARNREVPVVEEDAELNLRLGALYRDLKDAARASEYYRRVYEAASSSPAQRRDAAKDMAALYLKDADRAALDEAGSWAYRAARLDQTDAETQLLRAEILLRTESGVDREKAIEILMAVVNSKLPSGLEAKTYLLLGDAYYKNGEYRRAVEALETASEYDPSNSEILKKKRLAVAALRSGGR